MVKRQRIIRLKSEEAPKRKRGGNPPKKFQFQPGVSGNKKGRPRGSKNLKTIVMEAASDEVIATVNGKPRRLSKVQATVMQLATKAATGDPKAMREFIALVNEMETRASAAKPAQFPLSEPDIEVLRATYERMMQCHADKATD
jgi:hypothetical protein